MLGQNTMGSHHVQAVSSPRYSLRMRICVKPFVVGDHIPSTAHGIRFRGERAEPRNRMPVVAAEVIVVARKGWNTATSKEREVVESHCSDNMI